MNANGVGCVEKKARRGGMAEGWRGPEKHSGHADISLIPAKLRRAIVERCDQMPVLGFNCGVMTSI